MWTDEASIAISIINLPLDRIAHSLDYLQVAPLGFLWIEKIFITFFGISEYAFRLFPLICGILSIIAFYKLAKQIISKLFLPLSVFIFSVSFPLIDFSTEIKPYIVDVLIVILILNTALFMKNRRYTIRYGILFGILGSFLIYFSFPASFFLAGTGTSFFIYYIVNKQWGQLKAVSLSIILWIINIILYYFSFLKYFISSSYLSFFWHDGFLSSPFSMEGLGQWEVTFIRIFDYPGMYNLLSIPIGIIFIFGLIKLFKQSKFSFYILVSPVVFLTIASILHYYPIYGRLVLFLLPLIILGVIKGLASIYSKSHIRKSIVIFTLLIILLSQSVYGISSAIFPVEKCEIDVVFEYVENNRKQDDIIYIPFDVASLYEYYQLRMQIPESNYYVSNFAGRNREQYLKELEQLSENNERIWIITTHKTSWENPGFFEYRAFFLNYLSQAGELIDSLIAHEASAHLFYTDK
ncbi:MAG: glycosyltransferase family 39 protein [Patescibacteria group bacterium]